MHTKFQKSLSVKFLIHLRILSTENFIDKEECVND